MDKQELELRRERYTVYDSSEREVFLVDSHEENSVKLVLEGEELTYYFAVYNKSGRTKDELVEGVSRPIIFEKRV